MNRLNIFLFISLTTILNIQAQNFSRKSVSQTHSWYMYSGDHPFSAKWGVHLEAQIRRADFAKNWQQLLLRTALNFHLSSETFVSLGYGFVQTYPYGEFPVVSSFPEHRVYQQLQVNDKIGILEMQHRFRLEQRWLENTTSDKWDYMNRFRYLVRFSLPFKGKTIDNKELYLTCYDELFISFGNKVEYNILDQNRAYLALGYKFGKSGKLEAGYMNQLVAKGVLSEYVAGTSQVSNVQRFENNHTFIVGWYSSLPFYSYKKE